MTATQYLITACASLVLLTFLVGLRLFFTRIHEMRVRKISPQSIALSGAKTQKMQDQRASDNFSHLFELPVLFYALCAMAIAVQHVPVWLPYCAWLFVVLRLIHSGIQCTYNKVMHRFPVFVAGFILISGMWFAWMISVLFQ